EAGRHRLDLHLAVAQKDYRALETLLADGADVTTYDSRGRTALMNASEALDARMVEMLLKAGAQVNQLSEDEYKAPAIIYAASRQNRLDVVRLLHQAGARL